MANTFTLTVSKIRKSDMELVPAFNKWDLIVSYGAGGEAIVIRIKQSSDSISSCVFTLYPYKRFNKKWKQWVWDKYLRAKVWVGDLYK